MSELKHKPCPFCKSLKENFYYFTDELEAAKAYDTKARDLHKEYGRFNFG